MKRKPQQFLYIATDGVLFKIGITNNPYFRAYTLKVTLIKFWRRPYARQLETSVKSMFAHACVRGREWFALTEREILYTVTRMVRIEDDAHAIRLGIEPSKRPEPGEPPYEPAFELPWLKVTT